MHSICLVVGDGVEKQLEPFADYLEVGRYKAFLEPDGVASMASNYGIAATDLQSLAAKMPDWQQAEGSVEDGRLFYWSTANPNSKFEWYKVGGRFSGYLHLRQPVPPSVFGRLVGKRPLDRVDRAAKRDVDAQALLADPPAALLMDGTWNECPLTSDRAALAGWNRQFAELFARVPDDAMLTVVDIHS